MPVMMYTVSEAVTMSGLHRRVITKRCLEEKIGCQHASSGEWYLTEAEIASLTAEKRPRGRPKTVRVEALDAMIRANTRPEIIAETLGIKKTTVYNRISLLRKSDRLPLPAECGNHSPG